MAKLIPLVAIVRLIAAKKAGMAQIALVALQLLPGKIVISVMAISGAQIVIRSQLAKTAPPVLGLMATASALALVKHVGLENLATASLMGLPTKRWKILLIIAIQQLA